VGQVDLLVRVQKEVIVPSLVERLQHVQEPVDVEVLLAHPLFLHHPAVVVADELVEPVEVRSELRVFRNPEDIGVHRAGKGYLLGAFRQLVLPLPERQDQRLDALPLFHVELPVLAVEGIEGDRAVLLIRYVDPVLPAGALMDEPAQPLVAVSRVHQQDVRALLVIVAHEMVGEEGLAAARRPQDEFVAVGRDAPPHRLVRDIQMDGPATEPVRHLDAEGREGGGVVRLPDEEAGRLFDERMEGLLGGKIALSAGDARPIKGRRIHGIVPGLAAHLCQCRSGVVPDVPQPLPVLRPGHDVAMATHGDQAEGMRLVQVLLRPLPVDLVGAAVACERAHIPGRFLEIPEGLCRIIYEHVQVADMVMGQHQPHGSGKGEAAVAAVRGIFLITPVRPHRSGQVVHVGKRMHREPFVADAHFRAPEPDVLQRGGVLLRKGEVFLHQAGLLSLSGNLLRREPFQTDQPGVADDALELLHGFQEAEDAVLVPDLPGEDMPPAEDGEVALLPHALLRGTGDEQVREMVQEGPLVEMKLEAAVQESQLLSVGTCPVAFLQEPVLAVDDGMAGQYPDGLPSCAVHGLVIVGGEGEDLRQADLEADGHVRVLGEDAPVLDSEKGELTFQGGRFEYVSHIFFV